MTREEIRANARAKIRVDVDPTEGVGCRVEALDWNTAGVVIALRGLVQGLLVGMAEDGENLEDRTRLFHEVVDEAARAARNELNGKKE